MLFACTFVRAFSETRTGQVLRAWMAEALALVGEELGLDLL